MVMCWFIVYFFFFKQKTAYEIVSRDWSSDVCSSDLNDPGIWWTTNKTSCCVSRSSNSWIIVFGFQYSQCIVSWSESKIQTIIQDWQKFPTIPVSKNVQNPYPLVFLGWSMNWSIVHYQKTWETVRIIYLDKFQAV